MVQRLVGIGLAFVELLEAESARFRVNVKQVLVTAGLVAMGAVLVSVTLSVASGFLFWSAYLALSPEVGSAAAALILGAGLWIVVGGAVWLVANRLRSK